MALIPVIDLKPGMTLVEGPKRRPVRIVRDGHSCKGIHVNDTACYNRHATVEVTD